MAKLKKIGVLSFAKIYMVLMAIFGVLEGFVFAVAGTMVAAFAPQTEGAGLLAGLGWAGLILFPIVFGLMGFALGVLTAWLYNLIAGWVGPVELEIEQ